MTLNQLKLKDDYNIFDEDLFERVKQTPLENPRLISYNKDLCKLINLDYKECEKKEFVEFINGQKILKGSNPYATVYAGHQFGHFVPQLGDGRAINIGKIGEYYLQTKGSGLTKYSRMGDGKAVLRSSIREYLISEAMHFLGIPTTRSLAIIASDTLAKRDWEYEPCAIVLRASKSFVRIGTFEYFARTKKSKINLEKLAKYVIQNSYIHLLNDNKKYEKMFFELVDKTANLMALWQAYGFQHGVMNTDNFSVDGLTIDYGPFAFMDYFDKNNICNHTDTQGRYSYINQPYVARWNLFVLAESLNQICDEKVLIEYLKTFISQYQKNYLNIMSKRIGLEINNSSNNNLELINNLCLCLESSKIDYNLFFYSLTNLDSFEDIDSILNLTIYPKLLKDWFEKYKKICIEQNTSFEGRQEIMRQVNPKYTLKNYIIQEAINKALEDDFTLVNDLLNIAQNPFDEHKKFERYAKATPFELSNIKLSCSS